MGTSLLFLSSEMSTIYLRVDSRNTENVPLTKIHTYTLHPIFVNIIGSTKFSQ